MYLKKEFQNFITNPLQTFPSIFIVFYRILKPGTSKIPAEANDNMAVIMRKSFFTELTQDQ